MRGTFPRYNHRLYGVNSKQSRTVNVMASELKKKQSMQKSAARDKITHEGSDYG